MELPVVVVTSPEGRNTVFINFNPSPRYRAFPFHTTPSPPRPATTNSAFQSRKPRHLRLDLRDLSAPAPRSVYPVEVVDMAQFRVCTDSWDSFCHVCFLTAQEMATELTGLRPGAGTSFPASPSAFRPASPLPYSRPCKCGRSLPGPFCDACYAELDAWLRRLTECAAAAAEEARRRTSWYFPEECETWDYVDDHRWEAHVEVMDFYCEVVRDEDGTGTGAGTRPTRGFYGPRDWAYCLWEDVERAGLVEDREASFRSRMEVDRRELARIDPLAVPLRGSTPDGRGEDQEVVRPGRSFVAARDWLHHIWEELGLTDYLQDHESRYSSRRIAERQRELAQAKETRHQAKEKPKPKKRFWEREKPKGKRVRFVKKLRKIGLWKKPASWELDEDWEPFCEYDLSRLDSGRAFSVKWPRLPVRRNSRAKGW